LRGALAFAGFSGLAGFAGFAAFATGLSVLATSVFASGFFGAAGALGRGFALGSAVADIAGDTCAILAIFPIVCPISLFVKRAVTKGEQTANRADITGCPVVGKIFFRAGQPAPNPLWFHP
jgi:hypothetical protein